MANYAPPVGIDHLMVERSRIMLKPDPDPTLLTTAALLREIDQLRNLVRGWVDGLQLLMETQLRGAVATINTRLDGNDTALVAALKAQKEEAAKQTENFKEVLNESKKGTEKQIDSLNEKIDDLKKRVFEGDGRLSGQDRASIESRDNARNTIASVAVVVAIVMGFLGFLFGHSK